MRIGIIGCGVVGDALYTALHGQPVNGDELVRYDPRLFDTVPSDLADCKIAFVCVPSPMHPSGEQDDSIVRATLRMLIGAGFTGVVAIKSTLLPTKLRDLQETFSCLPLVSNPEFLTEKNAKSDCITASFHIVGSDNERARQTVAQLYHDYWPSARVVGTSLLCGMWIKYMINAHLALRVASMNEAYQLWQEVGDGTEWSDIVLALQLDDRMGGTHMSVPGPDGQLGFGGKCFPKDLRALIHMAREAGSALTTMEAAWDNNELIREDKDWLRIVGAVSDTPDTYIDPDESKDNATEE
jgi:UDPglucose 6-dehydrogenase